MEKMDSISSHIRIKTIDIFRALTMFLMIFVNDLWSLTGIPEWLGHMLAEEDGMGFSDIIFPLFLFIVGLSIPLAIDVRFKRKETRLAIVSHILTRTIALLVMGFYMVNLGVLNEEATGLDKNVWQILMAAAIFLIWLDYRRLPLLRNGLGRGLKILGLAILVYLAWLYQGGHAEISWMRPRWWGILGLIGWSYLLISLIYMWAGKRLGVLIPIFVVLLFMNIQENGFFASLPDFKIVISASNHSLVMAGMLCTIFYLKFREEAKSINPFLIYCVLAGLLFVIYGFFIRPVYPISKILATPSWTAICMGISLLAYVLLYVIIEKWDRYKWARPIKAAGTSTLTCYIMPFFVYPVLDLMGFRWPDFLTVGIVGLAKSLLFSLAIIGLVRMLEKINIRLKI